VTVGWEVSQSSAVQFRVHGANVASMLRSSEQMMQACCDLESKCCEHVAVQGANVASMLCATSNMRGPPLLLPGTTPKRPMLRPCCDSCCVQHPTSGALLPSSSTRNRTSQVCNIETQHPQHYNLIFATPNITCLHHQDSTSATSKNNVCNNKNI
jgi:hypothetical protein